MHGESVPVRLQRVAERFVDSRRKNLEGRQLPAPFGFRQGNLPAVRLEVDAARTPKVRTTLSNLYRSSRSCQGHSTTAFDACTCAAQSCRRQFRDAASTPPRDDVCARLQVARQKELRENALHDKTARFDGGDHYGRIEPRALRQNSYATPMGCSNRGRTLSWPRSHAARASLLSAKARSGFGSRWSRLLRGRGGSSSEGVRKA